MTLPAVPYGKPWLSYADQVKLLISRGLIVSDVGAAEQFLAHLNYYRFSGYCLAFELKRHEFVPNTLFEHVVSAYDFDLALRDLLTEALEVIEVDLRATIAYCFGRSHGAFGHTDEKNFHTATRHFEWLTRLREEAKRSSELFVRHFRNTYGEYPDLPIWMATEVMSFGSLSKMFGEMQKKDQKIVSSRFGLQPHVLSTAMHHFAYVRNLCAHHSRLWDRAWTIKPQLPVGKNWSPPLLLDNRRLFATLLLFWQLLTNIPAARPFASTWRTRVDEHLAKPPNCTDPLRKMGLTAVWDRHPLWRATV